jgi:hypothetical protein
MQVKPRFGELLSRLTSISRHDVEEILHEQETTQRRFGEIALAWGLCRPEHVWNVWCAQVAESGTKLDLKRIAIDSRAIDCITGEVARSLHILPIRLINEMLIIATGDLAVESQLPPLDKKLRLVLADRDELEHAIESHYKS